MMIQTEKIVDLSQKILRRGENFPFHSDYIGNRHTGQWYVMSNIFIGSHVATHVECPRHHIKDGLDCLHYPLENLIGSCVTLDCTGKEVDDPITLEEVMRYKDLIHKGDIIFLWTGFDKYHRTERWTDYRYIAEDAMEWLVSFEPKAIGVDAYGIEIPGADTGEPNHMRCFNRNIAVVEALTNLGKIANKRTTVFMLVLPMEGVDACPVRAIALQDEIPLDMNKIVELNQKLLQDKENFGFHSVYNGTNRPDWYVMSDILMGSHAGTHVEVPRHHLKDGLDCMHFPLERLMGDCITMDCSGKEVDEPITLEEVMRYKDQIKKGDIIFLWTGFDRFHRTERWRDYRYIAEDAMEWLVSFEPKAIGVDAFGIEIPGENTGEPNHMRCFNRNIAVVEALTNLGEIAGKRTSVLMLILPMEGVDACPVRAIAIQE